MEEKKKRRIKQTVFKLGISFYFMFGCSSKNNSSETFFLEFFFFFLTVTFLFFFWFSVEFLIGFFHLDF